MARLPRRERLIAGMFHITCRGNNKMDVFLDDDDRRYFLYLLGETMARRPFALYNYVLMSNHYHLRVGAIDSPKASLSESMRLLNGNYARWFNSRHGHTGHVWGKRFWHRPIRNDAQATGTGYYIELNPVKAGLCRHPGEYAWSSFAHWSGLRRDPLLSGTVHFNPLPYANVAAAATTPYAFEVMRWHAEREERYQELLAAEVVGYARRGRPPIRRGQPDLLMPRD